MTARSLTEITPIGYVTISFTDLSGTPSQASESTQSTGTVVLREDLVDALLCLDRYAFVWLVTWLIKENDEPAPIQCVPRAKEAEGKIQGVFASRSPRRPNSIGLSLVRQLEVVDNTITFAGVDLVDGTPVLDIKPWFEDCDLPPSYKCKGVAALVYEPL